MDSRSIRHRLNYGSYFVPFRFQLVVLVMAFLLGWRWMQKQNVLPDTAYTTIIALLIKLSLWFIAGILIFSLVTSILPWLFFLIKKKQGNVRFNIETGNKDNRFKDKQEVNINILPILRPLMGFVRLRLRYDNYAISPKFSLLDTQQKVQFFPSAIKGSYYWPLPYIREYNISEAVVYFEDMLQLFSFACAMPASDKFFVQPGIIPGDDLKVQPKKTVDTETRIDQIRKVEGEFLNYKNFENNDDVRRIVWKIYAKNKELVIRIPETNDPYASHVYFYASFYNDMFPVLYENVTAIFLNFYKIITWNAYRQLSKQDLEIRYIPDQELKSGVTGAESEMIKYGISTSEWQSDKEPEHFYKKENASVFCVSSLSDVKHLERILEDAGPDLVVIFVQVSKAFSSFRVKDWFQWIFVKPATDSLDKLRLQWNILPGKRKLLENEKAILTLLEKSNCTKMIA